MLLSIFQPIQIPLLIFQPIEMIVSIFQPKKNACFNISANRNAFFNISANRNACYIFQPTMVPRTVHVAHTGREPRVLYVVVRMEDSVLSVVRENPPASK